MRTAMLRECEFAALEAMLIAIFIGEATSLLLPSDSVPSAQSLASISMDEAASIGHLFRLVLGQSRVVDSVWPQITVKYPALCLADERHGWFRPMLETIGTRLKPSTMHV